MEEAEGGGMISEDPGGCPCCGDVMWLEADKWFTCTSCEFSFEISDPDWLASLRILQANRRKAHPMVRPLSEWHDDDGDAIWWGNDIMASCEPPSYIGSPLCSSWPFKDWAGCVWIPIPEYKIKEES